MFDRDYPNAIKWYEIAYNQGFIDAAYSLGLLYDDILRDYPKAIEWYEIAHDQKNTEASYALGIIYDTQLKDYKNALKWYEITIDLYKKQNRAHNGAMVRIAAMYSEGKGVKKDLAKARSLLEQVVNNTDPSWEVHKVAKQALTALDNAKPK
jgi:TPR repeat protein